MKTSEKSFAFISEILQGKHTGNSVRIRGWVHRQRTSGGLAFIVVRDSTGTIQCAVKKDAVDEGSWKDATELFVESSLEIEGAVKEDKRAPGGYEIAATQAKIICKGEAFPIAKDQSVEFLLDTRHLWLRSQKLSAIMKARHRIIHYLREFFEKESFWEVAPPIITKAGCEGGSTLFTVDYFGKPAYLTQSSQLYAEVFITALEKVFVLAPSFRAEPSRTVKHLTEYWHLEPEMAYFDYKMNIDLQERMIEYVCQKFAKENADLLEALGQKAERLLKVKAPFKRMKYEEAVKLINERGGKMKSGEDFGADEEMFLTKGEEKPIFVTHFPKEIKAFYMREDPHNPGFALCDDLYAPDGHGELIGGSERIWELDELLGRIKEQNLKEEDYQWYVDLRRYGSVPHSGFGLGIERLVKWMLDLEHIRDAIPFPRLINRVYP
ncbi:asparagine--tRNA ligase [Candidatus Micrarchaeota archaeon CG1_02_47_40]|nr:MAG: asparagine--tRNA ligase [Candidatus Micrarchaeota archaeon CG1_02_47_40]